MNGLIWSIIFGVSFGVMYAIGIKLVNYFNKITAIRIKARVSTAILRLNGN